MRQSGFDWRVLGLKEAGVARLMVLRSATGFDSALTSSVVCNALSAT